MGLIVELGTNPASGFGRGDLAATARSLPASTPIMFVLPYVELGSDPVVVSSWSQRVDGWMRSVAADRSNTCVADWPAYVRSHPGLLQDGIHPRNDAEVVWARWVLSEWERCAGER
jgi:lysophospholipase L1-like esterase